MKQQQKIIYATILSPSFHGLRKERLTQWPPICVQNTTKKPGGGGGVLQEKLGRGWRHGSWTLTLFQTKICDFSNPISDLIKNLIPYLALVQTLSPGARRVTGALNKLLQHVRGWRKY